jgi:UDPglucose--hexose-1-phosphate uridylyltransferase
MSSMARLNRHCEWVFLVPERGAINPLLIGEQDPSISITVSHRRDCPFCPPSRLSAERYDTLIFPNEHPVLSSADAAEGARSDDNSIDRIVGVNDVVIYTPRHNEYLHICDTARISRFVRRLRDRHREHFHQSQVEAIFTFLAAGQRFGQSQEHPHGQLLGLPFVPKRISLTTGADSSSCGICQQSVLAHEHDRVIGESPSFSAYITAAPRVPYEIWISAKEHNVSLAELDDEACAELAGLVMQSLRATQAAYFNPYIVSIFDVNPANERSHLRCEVLAFGRPSGTNKHMGAFELALGVFMNPSDPVQVAAALRAAVRPTI